MKTCQISCYLILVVPVSMVSGQDILTGNWTWLSGSASLNQPGYFGTKGIALADNQPGSRKGHSLVMHPSGKSISMFGGYGFVSASLYGFFNDMWEFDMDSGWWVWLSGAETTNQKGIYGTRGDASADNCPGARESHSMVIHPSGELVFMFGGDGFDKSGNLGSLNDMWTFNVISHDWKWLSGVDVVDGKGIYGTIGNASASSCPGARASHSMVILPSGQSIFIFGGNGNDRTLSSGSLNDMWMFNVTSGWWTWMSGSDEKNQKGTYRDFRNSNVNNQPGARYSHSMVTSPLGHVLFIFGGNGFDAASISGRLNDMWMLNLTSGWWTWISGADYNNQAAVYGSKGFADASYRPGARRSHSMVMHPSGQYIFVFGGWGWDRGASGRLNDMWMFNMTSGLWNWFSGSDRVNQEGIYGTQGSVHVSNQPSASHGHSMVMNPLRQMIFLWGGNHYDPSTLGTLNDMWKIVLSLPVHFYSDNRRLIYSTFSPTSDISTLIASTKVAVRESYLPSSLPSGPKSFWLYYIYIALLIIGAILLALFQLGFIIGFIYEGMVNTVRYDTESSSHRPGNIGPNSCGLTSKSSEDSQTSSYIPSIIASSNSSHSNPSPSHNRSIITENTTSIDLPTNVPPSTNSF